jgi:HEAT repeat protein
LPPEVKTKTSSIALAAIGAALLLLLWVAMRRSAQEPVYAGKPLSYWAEHASATEFAQSYRAIRAIGSEGVPWLLGRVRFLHGMRQRIYAAVWPNLPLHLRRRLAPPLNVSAVEEKVTFALSLLESNGVPSLVTAFRDRKSSVRKVAVSAIGRMLLTDQVVAQSVPELSKLLADPDESVRLAVVSTFGQMGARAKAAVPALIQVVSEPKPEVNQGSGRWFRVSAVRFLGLLGPEAKGAVPELRKLLAAPDRDLRRQAAIALWRIDHDTNMVAVLTSELEEGGLTTHPDVLAALGEMGPLAKNAVPAIVKMVEPPQPESFSPLDSTFALDVLDKIDRQAAERLRLSQSTRAQWNFIRRELASMRQHPGPTNRQLAPDFKLPNQNTGAKLEAP